jgi:hypothetical protein
MLASRAALAGEFCALAVPAKAAAATPAVKTISTIFLLMEASLLRLARESPALLIRGIFARRRFNDGDKDTAPHRLVAHSH